MAFFKGPRQKISARLASLWRGLFWGTLLGGGFWFAVAFIPTPWQTQQSIRLVLPLNDSGSNIPSEAATPERANDLAKTLSSKDFLADFARRPELKSSLTEQELSTSIQTRANSQAGTVTVVVTNTNPIVSAQLAEILPEHFTTYWQEQRLKDLMNDLDRIATQIDPKNKSSNLKTDQTIATPEMNLGSKSREEPADPLSLRLATEWRSVAAQRQSLEQEKSTWDEMAKNIGELSALSPQWRKAFAEQKLKLAFLARKPDSVEELRQTLTAIGTLLIGAHRQATNSVKALDQHDKTLSAKQSALAKAYAIRQGALKHNSSSDLPTTRLELDQISRDIVLFLREDVAFANFSAPKANPNIWQKHSDELSIAILLIVILLNMATSKRPVEFEEDLSAVGIPTLGIWIPQQASVS